MIKRFDTYATIEGINQISYGVTTMVLKERPQLDRETVIASPWVNIYTDSYMSDSQKEIASEYDVYQLTPFKQSRIVVMVGMSGHGGVYSVHTQYRGLGIEYRLDYSMEQGDYGLSLDEAKEVFKERATNNYVLTDEYRRIEAFDAIRVTKEKINTKKRFRIIQR